MGSDLDQLLRQARPSVPEYPDTDEIRRRGLRVQRAGRIRYAVVSSLGLVLLAVSILYVQAAPEARVEASGSSGPMASEDIAGGEDQDTGSDAPRWIRPDDFATLSTSMERPGIPGTSQVAQTGEELARLLDELGLEDKIDAPDITQYVVTRFTLWDADCPQDPQLLGFEEVEANKFTPREDRSVFRACHLTSSPRDFVVAIKRDAIPDGALLFIPDWPDRGYSGSETSLLPG